MENNIDKLFKSKLGNDVPEFDPNSWDRMSTLIDNEIGTEKRPKVGFWNWSRLISMLLLLSFGLGIGYVIGNSTKEQISAMQLGPDEARDNVKSKELTVVAQKDSHVSNISESKQDLSIEKENINKLSTNTYSNNHQRTISSSTAALARNVQNKVKNSLSKLQPEPSDIALNDIHNSTSNGTLETQNSAFQNNINPASQIGNKVISQFADQENDNSIDETEVMTTSTSTESLLTKAYVGDTSLGKKMEGINEKEFIDIDYLASLDLVLEPKENGLTIPINILRNDDHKLTVGLKSDISYSGGFLYRVGPSMNYNLNETWGISSGLNFESSSMKEGTFSVQEKIYSFGSTITERQFSVERRNTITLPLLLTYKIGQVSLNAGVSLNHTFAVKGGLSDRAEVDPDVAWISNDELKALNLHYHIAGSYGLSRNTSLSLGIEYRPSFVGNAVVANTIENRFLPTLGFHYLLIKK